MTRYRKVPCKLWMDRKFTSMSERGKLVYLYLLTNQNTNNIPGLYRLGEYQAAEELGMVLEGFREGFREPFRKGLVKADWTHRVVWIVDAIEYNRPENPNVVKSWVSCLDEVPDCDIKIEAIQTLGRVIETMPEGFKEPFRKGFAMVTEIKNKSIIQEQEQEQETRLLPPVQIANEKLALDIKAEILPSPSALVTKTRSVKPVDEKPTQTLKAKYFELYTGKYGAPPAVWGAKENTHAKRLLSSISLERAIELLEFFFDWNNKEAIDGGHSFATGYRCFLVKLEELQADILKPERRITSQMAAIQMKRMAQEQQMALDNKRLIEKLEAEQMGRLHEH